MYTIRESVGEKLAASGPTVESLVIEKLVQIEVDARVDTIMRALTLREKFEKALKKINRPDTITYVDNERREATSEARFKEITAATEKLDKLDKLINDALEVNDTEKYGKLNEFLKSNPGDSSGDSK